MCIPKIYFCFNDNFDLFIFPVDCLTFATSPQEYYQPRHEIQLVLFHYYLHGQVGLTSRVFITLIVEDSSVANKWFLVLLPV